MAYLALALLGPLHITLDARPVAAFDYDKVRALLAYLAVEADRAHRRAVLAGLLWPDQSEQAAHTSLRQALATLRRAIGDHAAAAPFLHITREAIQFNLASDHGLDVAAFTALLAACERHLHRHPETCSSCARRLQEAVALYRGDFLAQFYLPDSIPFEEWALLKREHLHRLIMQALIQLANYSERHRDYAQTQRYASRQLEFEPWREEAHQQLMRVFVLSDQRSAALAQYETCRQILACDLRVEPEAETTALYEQIRDTPSSELRVLRSEFHVTAAATQNAKRKTQNASNFPAQTTLLIGRETELVELGTLLENPACRLITIVGPGGMGKTRLALAAATEQAPTWTHGAAFVPLAAMSSASFLSPAILTALDVALQGQRDPRDQLLDELRDKELLLLLDNFEQLLAPDLREDESGAVLLTDMLQRAPRVTLLVTSRERLALPGEWVFDLAGLSYPPGDPIDGVEAYDSMRLFLQRAGQVRRQFALADGEARAVARICRLVEGLPLAIELAAAGLRTRSCAAIADAIERSLSALATGLRAIPERHRSMWATFEHSWRLLSEEERQVFPRLSVFRGGFEEDAAAQVAQATPQLLAMLVDKSLLRWEGVARYDLHELVRQYAGEKLDEAGETERLRQQHARYYVTHWDLPNRIPRSPAPMAQLERDYDNLWAALTWSQTAAGDSEIALRLAGGLRTLWMRRGMRREAIAVLERSLNHPRGVGRTVGHAAARFALGSFLGYTGNYAAARIQFEEAVQVAHEVGDPLWSSAALECLGWVAGEQGDSATAWARLSESLAIGRAQDNADRIAYTLVAMARVAILDEDPARAEALLEERSRLRLSEPDNPNSLGWALNQLGNAAQLRGAYDRAAQLHQESLECFQAFGDYNPGRAYTYHNLGETALGRGNLDEAVGYLAQGLALSKVLGAQNIIAWCLAGLGSVAALDEEPERAARLWGAAERVRQSIGCRPAPAARATYERALATARAQLSEEAFAASWDEGRAMTVEQAVVYALEVGAADTAAPVSVASSTQ